MTGPDHPHVRRLLEAVRAHPANPLCRLVLADWLEDHGGDLMRAELLRLDATLENWPDDGLPLRAELLARAQELAAAGRPAWWPAPPPADDFKPADRFLGWSLAFGPWRLALDVGVLLDTDFFPRLTDVPACWLAEVHLWSHARGGHDWRDLAKQPALANLVRLELHSPEVGRGDNEVAGELLASPHLPPLRALAVTNRLLGYLDGLRALLQRPCASALESLNLSGNNLGTPGAELLVAVPVLAALEALVLHDNDLQLDALKPLFAGPHFAKLERLDLSHNPLGDRGAKAAAELALPKLRELVLRSCYISKLGAAALAEAATLDGLERLDLRGNLFGKRAKSALRDRFGGRVVV